MSVRIRILLKQVRKERSSNQEYLGSPSVAKLSLDNAKEILDTQEAIQKATGVQTKVPPPYGAINNAINDCQTNPSSCGMWIA